MARTSCFVAEVVRRRLVSTSPRVRPPKRGIGAGGRRPSVTPEEEGSPSSPCAPRRGDRDPDRAVETRCGIGRRPEGGAQAPLRRSLTREGTPGRHASLPRHEGERSRRPRRIARYRSSPKGTGRERQCVTGVSEVRPARAAREDNAPAQLEWSPPKRPPDVVNHPVSLVPTVSLTRARGRPLSEPRAESVAVFATHRERARYGSTFSFGWHPSVGRIVRLSHRRGR